MLIDPDFLRFALNEKRHQIEIASEEDKPRLLAECAEIERRLMQIGGTVCS